MARSVHEGRKFANGCPASNLRLKLRFLTVVIGLRYFTDIARTEDDGPILFLAAWQIKVPVRSATATESAPGSSYVTSVVGALQRSSSRQLLMCQLRPVSARTVSAAEPCSPRPLAKRPSAHPELRFSSEPYFLSMPFCGPCTVRTTFLAVWGSVKQNCHCWLKLSDGKGSCPKHACTLLSGLYMYHNKVCDGNICCWISLFFFWRHM